MTTQNWPDLKRPGVPMFAERDGWHILRHNPYRSGDYFIYWNSKEKLWADGRCHNLFHIPSPHECSQVPDDIACWYAYIAPVLTPTQINEMLAAERERCILVCENEGKAFKSPEYAGGKSNAWGELFAVNECIEAIRNLGAAP